MTGENEVDVLSGENQIAAERALLQGLSSQMAVSYYWRGLAYYRLGNNKQAIEDMSQALILEPTFAKAYQHRGKLYDNQGYLELALSDYTQAIELDPQDAISWQYRGVVNLKFSDYWEAIDDITQALILNPSCSACYRYRGLAHLRLNEKEKALEDYNQALELNPRSAETYYYRSQIFECLSEYEQAQTDLEQACQWDNANKECAVKLAEIRNIQIANAGLWEGVKAGDIEKIKLKLDEGADINIRDAEGNNLLVYALALDETHRLSVTRCLMEHAINRRAINSQGHSLLMAAVYLRATEIVTWILEPKSSWVRVIDREYEAALDIAIQQGNTEMAKLIISYSPVRICNQLMSKINDVDSAVTLSAQSRTLNLGEIERACRRRRLLSEWECIKWRIRKAIKFLQTIDSFQTANSYLDKLLIPELTQRFQAANSYLDELLKSEQAQRLFDLICAGLASISVWKRLNERLKLFGSLPAVQGEIISFPAEAIDELDYNALPLEDRIDHPAISSATNAAPFAVRAPSLPQPQVSTALLALVLSRLMLDGVQKIPKIIQAIAKRKSEDAVITTEQEALYPHYQQLKTKCEQKLASDGSKQDKWYRYYLEDMLEELDNTSLAELNAEKINEWKQALEALEEDYGVFSCQVREGGNTGRAVSYTEPAEPYREASMLSAWLPRASHQPVLAAQGYR